MCYAKVVRASPKNHPLAVLRLFLGLGQKEMAELGACSKSTVQAIELRKLSISKSLAARFSQTTGVSGRWLLSGDPTEPMMNDDDEAYSVEDFVSCSVQYQQFSHPENKAREILEFQNQMRALELEEIFNRSIKAEKWPVVNLMWTLFRDSVLKELAGEGVEIEVDYYLAAKSFLSRWEKHKNGIYDNGAGFIALQRNALRMVEGKGVTFNESILAKVYANHPDGYWGPILDAVKATKKSLKRPKKKRKKR